MNGSNDHPKPPDLTRALAGGHATGNLSEEEKQRLYEAALRDQDLFDALMEEEAFRELLEEPGVRTRLLEALNPRPGVWERFRQWVGSPMAWGAAGAVAAAAVLLVVLTPRMANVPLRQAQNVTVRMQDSPAPRADAPKAAAAASPKQERASRKPDVSSPLPAAKENADLLSNIPKDLAKNEAGNPKAEEQSTAGARTGPVEARQGRMVSAERDRKESVIAGAVAPAAPVARPIVAQTPSPIPPPPAVRVSEPPAAVIGGVASTAGGEAKAKSRAALTDSTGEVSILALDYRLLKRNVDGRYEPVTGATVGAWDELRLQVISNASGTLIVLSQAATGQRTSLSAPLLISAGQTVMVPAQGSFSAVNSSTLVLTFSRDVGTGLATSMRRQTFRQNVQPGRVQEAVEVTATNTLAKSDEQPKKVSLPAPALIRSTAANLNARELTVEITIRGQKE